jgi:hypothetical protein
MTTHPRSIDTPSVEQYIANKRNAEFRNAGYKKYSSVTVVHAYPNCPCDGMNLRCRQVKTEWRKGSDRKPYWVARDLL